MWQTLSDPLQALLFVTGVAMIIETLLGERYKEGLRRALQVVQTWPLVPPRAIKVVDRLFGAKIFSLRSILLSMSFSIGGALITVLIISLTTPDVSQLANEAAHVVTSFPIPIALFCVAFLFFDFLSYLVTRLLVVSVVQAASVTRGLIFFFSDLLVSTALCVSGLSLASTIFVFSAPDSFWAEPPPSTLVTPPELIIDVILADLKLDATFSLTFGLSPLPSMPVAKKSEIDAVGLVGVLRASNKKHSSAQVDIALGADPDNIIAVLNTQPRKYVVGRWTCKGDELSPKARQELLRALYGSSPQPACPIPTFFWVENTDKLKAIEAERFDDIFIGMASLYLKELSELLETKLNRYVKVAIPDEWSAVVYRSSYLDGVEWGTHNYASEQPPGYQIEYLYPIMASHPNYGKEVIAPAIPEPPPREAEQQIADDKPAGETIAEWGYDTSSYTYTDYSSSNYAHTDNYSYTTYYSDDLYAFRTFGPEPPSNGAAFYMPVSPFLGSALWMSIVFYVFAILALGAFLLRQILALKDFLMRTLVWTRAPVSFVGFIIGAVFAAASFALQLLPP